MMTGNRKYKHHKYTWSKPFSSVQHRWELVGPMGGIHFHVSVTDGYDPSCGLEFHHTRACGLRTHEAPDNLRCRLTGEPCWHEGTSVYASGQIWPFAEPYLRTGAHETIFRRLEREADEHFSKFVAELKQGKSHDD